MLSNALSTLTASLALFSTATSLSIDHEQDPLGEAKARSPLEKIAHALEKAEIIPTVIAPFMPKHALFLEWHTRATNLGNTIKPSKLQSRPKIGMVAGDQLSTTASTTSSSHDWAAHPRNIVVALTDPDAPSRANPVWSEICHMLVHVYIAEPLHLLHASASSALSFTLDLDASTLTAHSSDDADGTTVPSPDYVATTLVGYKPPGPPPGTGKHRYVALAFIPANLTSAPLLHLSVPGERVYWGTGEQGGGVAGWAERNGLVPVAANFIYSQNKKQ